MSKNIQQDNDKKTLMLVIVGLLVIGILAVVAFLTFKNTLGKLPSTNNSEINNQNLDDTISVNQPILDTDSIKINISNIQKVDDTLKVHIDVENYTEYTYNITCKDALLNGLSTKDISLAIKSTKGNTQSSIDIKGGDLDNTIAKFKLNIIDFNATDSEMTSNEIIIKIENKEVTIFKTTVLNKIVEESNNENNNTSENNENTEPTESSEPIEEIEPSNETPESNENENQTEKENTGNNTDTDYTDRTNVGNEETGDFYLPGKYTLTSDGMYTSANGYKALAERIYGVEASELTQQLYNAMYEQGFVFMDHMDLVDETMEEYVLDGEELLYYKYQYKQYLIRAAAVDYTIFMFVTTIPYECVDSQVVTLFIPTADYNTEEVSQYLENITKVQ